MNQDSQRRSTTAWIIGFVLFHTVLAAVVCVVVIAGIKVSRVVRFYGRQYIDDYHRAASIEAVKAAERGDSGSGNHPFTPIAAVALLTGGAWIATKKREEAKTFMANARNYLVRRTTPLGRAEWDLRKQVAKIGELAGVTYIPQEITQYSGFFQEISKSVQMGRLTKNQDQLTLLIDSATRALTAYVQLQRTAEVVNKQKDLEIADLDLQIAQKKYAQRALENGIPLSTKTGNLENTDHRSLPDPTIHDAIIGKRIK